MLISCPVCAKTYQVADEAIPLEGRDVECSACGTIWFEAGPLQAYLDAEFTEADGQDEEVTALTPRAADLTLGLDTGRAAAIVDAVYDDAGPLPRAALALPSPVPAAPASGGTNAQWDEPLIFDDEPAPVRPQGPDRPSLFGSRRQAPRPATPGDRVAARLRRRFRAHERNRLTPLRAAGWALWGGAVLALALGVTTERARIEAAWPKTADVYALFVPPPASPVTVEARSTAYAQSTHGPVLEVRGTLRNGGAESVLPHLELIARHGERETRLPIRVSDVRVPARGERPFVFRAQVPEGLETAHVRLADQTGEAARYRYVMQNAGSGWGAPVAPSQSALGGRGPR